MGKKSWTDSDLIEAVRTSTTIADTLRKINLVPRGANYRTVHSEVKRLGIDTSHWLGLSHLRGKKRLLPQVELSKVLVENCEYNSATLKKRLLSLGLIDEKCGVCGQEDIWNGKKLVMVLDHINGVNNDNRIENLRMLCPNCNSQQNTFCGKKNKGRKRYEEWKCKQCGVVVSKDASLCRSCYNKSKRRVEWPSLKCLLQDVNESNFEAVGRKYGVSGKTIRDWIKYYEGKV